MSDESVLDLLAGLASAQPDTAWRDFLQRYSANILQIVGRYEHGPQRIDECFDHVCQALSDGRFRRLLSFQPSGPAKFRTWLMAVTANLCIDWRRRKRGRFRPVHAVTHLSELDQLVYRYVFVRGIPRSECLHMLEGRYPGLNEQQLAEINARLFAILKPQQRWQLGTRAAAAGPQGDAVALELADETFQLEDTTAGPEEIAQSDQERDRLAAAMSQLPATQRLLLRLRFEQNLTLAEVARLTGLKDPFRAHRQIQAALAALAAVMTCPAQVSDRKKQ